MPLVTTKEMFERSMKEHFSIGAFNINNMEFIQAITDAAEEAKSPVILQVSSSAIKYARMNYLMKMVEAATENSEIPVAIHLDHGPDFETCKKCVDAGFTSVMFDGSKYDFEENIAITKKVVEYAHEHNVTVEAEVGHIGGTEDNITATSSNATLADCLTLVNGTGIDSLAPALGSVHGLYKGEPNLDFVTMAEINENLTIPLVLHGGTGIPDYDIKKAISCGISKININTELQIAWHDAVKSFINENPDAYDPRKVIGSGKESMKAKIKEKVEMFNNK